TLSLLRRVEVYNSDAVLSGAGNGRDGHLVPVVINQRRKHSNPGLAVVGRDARIEVARAMVFNKPDQRPDHTGALQAQADVLRPKLFVETKARGEHDRIVDDRRTPIGDES